VPGARATIGGPRSRTGGTRPGRYPFVAGDSWETLTVAADGSVTP